MQYRKKETANRLVKAMLMPKRNYSRNTRNAFEVLVSSLAGITLDLKQDAETVVHSPRRVHESMKYAVMKELKRMIEIYVIEKVDQPIDWVNRVVYVTKPSGELRICPDPKDLNNCVRRPHHYTHILDDILPQLQGASVFSILDARSGYWNVKLDDESKLLTTFNAPYGRYCFRRLPFRLVSAQDVFQKKVDQTFEGLPGVVAIADDIVVFGQTEAEHDELDNLMKRTQEKYDFTVNSVPGNADGLQMDCHVYLFMVVKFPTSTNEIVVLNGVLLKGNRVIIPNNMQEEVLMKIHTGHQGIEECRLRARDTVYWCGINAYIDNMVNKYYYSSYIIIRKLSSTASGAIVSKLKLIFSEFGIPDIFISDNSKLNTTSSTRRVAPHILSTQWEG
ncbi:hypothetical protein NP493_940g00016 [Ridgeia piscesae]|uniref:Reverse transcriptase domain-containing protein n=1 Tax=Ridgeia piscesae TaxID=27915 RepID=A0AAD9NJK3_RIDPI|nr:hypothetical protein NP493_940g00016 [Ridgeia piscesae]